MNNATRYGNDKIERYLNELSAEYKQLLFESLIERSSSVENLSVSDLLRLDNEVKKPLLANYRRYMRKRKMLAIIGVAYILMGVFTFLLYHVYNQVSHSFFDEEGLISLFCLVISFVGMVSCCFSLIIPQESYNRKSIQRTSNQENGLTPSLEYEVIAKWRDLEGIVSDFSVDSRLRAPASAINYLRQNGLIDESEHEILKKFLRIRNEVVHSGVQHFSVKEIQDTLKKTNQIIDKVKNVLQ